MLSSSGLKIRVWVDEGDLWRVDVPSSLSLTGNGGAEEGTVPVEVLVEKIGGIAGAVPVLNRPVVLAPDGTVPTPEGERTFLQKYWWVLLAGLLLVVSGGSGGE